MLFSRMDLLNPQFLDKMNNNIGRLHYEGESRMPSLPTAMSNMRTGPPPICPSKRKYGEEQVDDHIDCDNDHMTKMSRLFAAQLARPTGGDNRNEHWSLGHSPVECITSASNGLHGNHLYASIPGYGVDQPLALTKSNMDLALGSSERSAVAGAVERQQNRPSVITCAPASNRNCNLSHCHMNGCAPSPPIDQRKTNANTVCDPVIEEHFRRSLGTTMCSITCWRDPVRKRGPPFTSSNLRSTTTSTRVIRNCTEESYSRSEEKEKGWLDLHCNNKRERKQERGHQMLSDRLCLSTAW